MEKLYMIVVFSVCVGWVVGDPIKCFVCTGPVSNVDDACVKKQAAGGEQDCAETETKCVTKLENDQVTRACAADAVVDADNVKTCAAAACNADAWEATGNATEKKDSKREGDPAAAAAAAGAPADAAAGGGDAGGEGDAAATKLGNAIVPMAIMMIIPFFVIVKQ